MSSSVDLRLKLSQCVGMRAPVSELRWFDVFLHKVEGWGGEGAGSRSSQGVPLETASPPLQKWTNQPSGPSSGQPKNRPCAAQDSSSSCLGPTGMCILGSWAPCPMAGFCKLFPAASELPVGAGAGPSPLPSPPLLYPSFLHPSPPPPSEAPGSSLRGREHPQEREVYFVHFLSPWT